MEEPTKKAWQKLDNAAKIFPPTSGKSDTRVFRFSCELSEAVNGELLQSALDRAIDDFPNFQYVLKRGMFWYYLEQSDMRPLARPESSPPCGTIYLSHKTLLFEVTWYLNRINLEVFHTLTDGTGALQFLKTLALYYLKLAHPDAMWGVTSIDYDASETQKMSDSFNKYYDGTKHGHKSKYSTAFQIKGARESEWRLKIIEGTVSTSEFLQKAREHGTTITVLVTAVLIRAIYADMSVRDRRKPVVISVPVNLRNFFDSKSTRNFFSAVDIKYSFSGNDDTLEDIVKGVKEGFDKQLTKEYLQNRLNNLLRLEYNFFTRLIPLSFKNLIMRLVYYFSAREFTASLSNVGKVVMPEKARPYIRLFDVFSSTNKLQICLCSYEDNMNISFSSPFVSTDIQRSFFRQLTQMGLSVTITANDLGNKKKPSAYLQNEESPQQDYEIKTCEKCTVTVSGDFDKCPLCQNPLAGEENYGNQVFPFVPIVKYEHSLLFRLLLFCSAAIVIISVTINWMLPESGYWSLFITAGVACVWIGLLTAIRKRHEVLKNISYQATIVSVLSVLWDAITGWHGWSIDFVVPIAFVCAMTVTPILARILKMQAGAHIIYMFLLILYGIIPAVFVFGGWSGIIYPSVICVAVSLFSLAGLLIFEGASMVEELKRRLHL